MFSRIDYDDPRLATAMKNHKAGTVTVEDIEYMTKCFRNGNSNIFKLGFAKLKKLKWGKPLGFS